MPDRTSSHDTSTAAIGQTPRTPYQLSGGCCSTVGVPAIGHAIAHLEGLRIHLDELGLRAEANAVSTILDWLIPTRVCRRAHLP